MAVNLSEYHLQLPLAATKTMSRFTVLYLQGQEINSLNGPFFLIFMCSYSKSESCLP